MSACPDCERMAIIHSGAGDVLAANGLVGFAKKEWGQGTSVRDSCQHGKAPANRRLSDVATDPTEFTVEVEWAQAAASVAQKLDPESFVTQALTRVVELMVQMNGKLAIANYLNATPDERKPRE